MPAPVDSPFFRSTETPHIPLKIEKEPDHFKVAKVVFPILFSLAGFLVLAFDVAFTLTTIVSLGALFLYHEKENDSSSRLSGPFGGMKTPSKLMQTNYLEMSDGSPLTEKAVTHLKGKFPDIDFCPVDRNGTPEDDLEISDVVPVSPETLDSIKKQFPNMRLSPFAQQMDNVSEWSARNFKGKLKPTPGGLSPIDEHECMRALSYTPMTPQSSTSPQGSPMNMCSKSSCNGKILYNRPPRSSRTPLSDVKKKVSFGTEREDKPLSLEEEGESVTPRRAREVIYFLQEKFPNLSPFHPKNKGILRNSITPRTPTPSSSGDLSTPSLSPLASPRGRNWKKRAGSTPRDYLSPLTPVVHSYPYSAPARPRHRNPNKEQLYLTSPNKENLCQESILL